MMVFNRCNKFLGRINAFPKNTGTLNKRQGNNGNQQESIKESGQFSFATKTPHNFFK
jgi:hypothetical protein